MWANKWWGELWYYFLSYINFNNSYNHIHSGKENKEIELINNIGGRWQQIDGWIVWVECHILGIC